jgi:signal transduction histidine kinase
MGANRYSICILISIIFTLHLFSQDTAVIANLTTKINKYKNEKLRRGEKNHTAADSTLLLLMHERTVETYRNDPEKALKYIKEMESLARETEFRKGLFLTYNAAGNIYANMGNIPKAIEYQHKSIKIAEADSAFEQMAMAYGNLGNSYADLRNFPEALTYHEKSLKIDEKIGRQTGKAATYANIGSIYLEQRDFQKAIIQYKKSLELYEKLKNDYGLAMVLGNIGGAYLELGDSKNALAYIMRAVTYAEKTGETINMAILYSTIGLIHHTLKEYEKAIYYEKKALDMANEIKLLGLVSTCQYNLIDIYSAKGDYRKALEYATLYKQTEDTLFNRDKNNKLTELKLQFEFDKKEALLKAQQEKKDKIMEATVAGYARERILYFALFIVLLFGLFTLRSRLQLAKRTRLIVEQKNEQIKIERENAARERTRAEILDIRNKIAKDLHDDIGAALSSISIYGEVVRKMSSEKLPEASLIIDKVEDIAHDAMENMNDIVWTINPGNDHVEDIIQRIKKLGSQLEEMRNIKVHYDISDDLYKFTLSMPQRKNIYLVFKEALNNIAKYARANNCYISMHKKDKKIAVTIRDDGSGFGESKKAPGNGLINMRKRVEELGGELTIDSIAGNGCEIKFYFGI